MNRGTFATGTNANRPDRDLTMISRNIKVGDKAYYFYPSDCQILVFDVVVARDPACSRELSVGEANTAIGFYASREECARAEATRLAEKIVVVEAIARDILHGIVQDKNSFKHCQYILSQIVAERRVNG
jgi:hypothetical protein